MGELGPSEASAKAATGGEDVLTEERNDERPSVAAAMDGGPATTAVVVGMWVDSGSVSTTAWCPWCGALDVVVDISGRRAMAPTVKLDDDTGSAGRGPLGKGEADITGLEEGPCSQWGWFEEWSSCDERWASGAWNPQPELWLWGGRELGC